MKVKWGCGHSRKSTATNSIERRFEILEASNWICPQCANEIGNDSTVVYPDIFITLCGKVR